MENREQFIVELAKVFSTQAEATAVLENVGYPRDRLPNWQAFTNPGQFWTRVVTEVENGRLERGGAEVLAAAARDQFPRNRIFIQTAAHLPGPLPETRIVPVTRTNHAPGVAGTQHIEEWPTLIFHGSDRYDEFLRLVRDIVGPQAQLLYAAADEAAVLVHGADADGADLDALVAVLQQAVDRLDLPGEGRVHVRFERYDYRPHLIERFRVVGPDQQVFIAENIPNTTPVRDIPAAMFTQYGAETQRDRLGRNRRAVVDRVRPPQAPGEADRRDRLDPNHTLEQAGVTEGDELHVSPESTAGAADQNRLDALTRVRNEIEEYAEENAGSFAVVWKDDPFLPTAYEIEFSACGFAPPEDMSGDPAFFDPVERDTHRASLILTDLFPYKAPLVLFATPIFHPNIEPGQHKVRPKGLVCIGLLGEAYRPDLDFYDLCKLIIDIAAYRNYGAIPHGVLGEHGFFNHLAAVWAISEYGQERILARGGRPLTEVLALDRMLGLDDAPSPLRLRIRPERSARS